MTTPPRRAPFQPWWEPLIRQALREGAIVGLAAEFAQILDNLYLALALVYAELPHEDAIPSEDKQRRDLASLLGRAIRSPNQFDWGQMVHASFRERLRALFGTEVIPPTWPDKPHAATGAGLR